MHHHDYKTIQTTSDGILEICNECKHRLTTRLDSKGRPDNRKYLLDHVRDTCQPRGRTGKVFDKYYKNNKTK